MQRVRLTYARGEDLLYVGNLDIHKIWERTFRRAEIHLAYSQGFHPQPRIHQACPLPLGFTSSNEILDFWLDSDESLNEIEVKLKKSIQPGITILNLINVPLNSSALQTLVRAARYRIQIDEPVSIANLKKVLDAFMSNKDCYRERRGKSYDLMPLIKDLKLVEAPNPVIEMTLVTLPGATGRPEEVLDELSIPITSVSIDRTELVFDLE